VARESCLSGFSILIRAQTDRDPEAEAEDKVDEDKLPGVDEEGAQAIESGFATSGGEWEAAAPGFAATSGGEWGDAQAGQEWGAGGNANTTAAPTTAATTGQWGADGAGDSKPAAAENW
jgi:small subunit ribosomal protein SAe